MDAMDAATILVLLNELGTLAAGVCAAEITLVGGAAGMLTGALSPTRTTIDCDVIRTDPPECYALLLPLAAEIAHRHDLPSDWFSDRVAQLDVLPVGWRQRRVHVGDFGSLRVWSIARIDLMAMKVFAGRMQDRADVLEMRPTAAEAEFVHRYLDQLRVPSRNANLDQVQSAFRFLAALEATL